jgi:hypothetical protein
VPQLTRITIYPVKSLEGVDVPEAVVLPGGALEHDRRFAMVDEDGRIINGKRTDQVHGVRSSYDPSARVLTLGIRGGGGPTSFQVDTDRDALHAWLGEYFGLPVALREAPATGFPDDTDAPGPTVVAAATLEAVADWFGGLDPDECRGRFRANLEIGGAEPFWDDRLYAGAGSAVRFRVGGVTFEGVNPCQRCPVPARSPTTGEPTRGFQKRFAALREQTLPPWATAARFDHFYRLAVNTRRPALDSEPGEIRVGDEVEILDNGSNRPEPTGV